MKHKESSLLYQIIMFALMGVGLLVILANYIGLVPGGTDNKFLVFGLGGIAVGFGMTLWYH